MQTSKTHSVECCRRLPKVYSKRQREEAEAFLERNPIAENLYGRFSPRNWGWAIMNVDGCMTKPCILLMHVDEIYGKQGLAKTIVKENITGVYGMSIAREGINVTAAEQAAELFVANYGHQCTLYQLLVYFAKYISDFKESRSYFDFQDILQQYRKKFLPWWAANLPKPQEGETKPNKVVGQQALDEYLRSIAARGEDIRQCNLYKSGIVKDENIQRIEQNNVF